MKYIYILYYAHVEQISVPKKASMTWRNFKVSLILNASQSQKL